MSSKILRLSEIPTLNASYSSRHIFASKATTNSKCSLAYNDKVSLICYDITRLDVDAIVNAANTALRGGLGVDGAIHKAAGPILLTSCRQYRKCDVGDAVITPGHKLPAKHVIHTVGPVYTETQSHEESERLLKCCYTTTLAVAQKHALRSVAFCSISTGVYGYPFESAAQTVVDLLYEWLQSPENAASVDRIIICCFSQSDEEVYLRLLPERFQPQAKA